MRGRRSPYASIYGSWMPGIVLIVLGAIFLAENYFGATLRNWWALFILIPTAGSLATAYAFWKDGKPDLAIGPLVVGLGLALLTAAFLLDLPIGQLWPVFLIVAGLVLLLRSRGSR